MNINIIAVSALEYFQDPAVQEKVEEVGRIIYSNDSVTVNLSAVIAAGILALLGGSSPNRPPLFLGSSEFSRVSLKKIAPFFWTKTAAEPS